MPVLLEEHEIKIEWTDILTRRVRKKPKSTEVRSSGVHLSGVIRHCLTSMGKLTVDEIRNEEMPLRMAVGMAWEDWSVGLWPDMIWQPGEKELDGVFGSPDGLSYMGVEQPTVEEYKATWKSRRTYGNVVESSLWMWQLAGYCKMLKVTRARMHILWVCGDYKLGPPSPAYVTYLIDFTQSELDQFWKNIVLKNKDSASREEH